jgi:hypothetical protein
MADFGFPEITHSFLANQDLFYAQFNDIDFYVEDIYQENLYLRILKKFFPEIKITKILPLGGKSFVLEAARNSTGNRKKIFIVDLDFDGIFGLKEQLENLFYLKAYSVENYLLEKEAIIEFIKEQNPKLNEGEILRRFDFDEFRVECQELFSDIIKSYLVIQKYFLDLKNVDLGPSYFYDLTQPNPQINAITWIRHKEAIQEKLNEIDSSYMFIEKLSEYDEYFETVETGLSNIPGKYLLKFLKNRIEMLFDIAKTNIESLTYRLSGHCVLESLEFIQTDIKKYINNN